jgi:hypothetical protein
MVLLPRGTPRPKQARHVLRRSPLQGHLLPCASPHPGFACRWLLARAGGVRSLRLQGPRISNKAELRRTWAIVSIALAALGPTLTELRLSWEGPLELQGWMGHMQQLEQVVIRAPKVTIGPQLASLGCLRVLRLRGGAVYVTAGPGAKPYLPPALGEFSLGVLSWPRGLFGAGLGLVSLRLHSWYSLSKLGDLKDLDSLTTLRELRLFG